MHFLHNVVHRCDKEGGMYDYHCLDYQWPLVRMRAIIHDFLPHHGVSSVDADGTHREHSVPTSLLASHSMPACFNAARPSAAASSLLFPSFNAVLLAALYAREITQCRVVFKTRFTFRVVVTDWPAEAGGGRSERTGCVAEESFRLFGCCGSATDSVCTGASRPS